MAEQIISKRCRVCKQTKPITEFCKDNRAKDKHEGACKICCLKSQKRYDQTERGKATYKRYRQSKKGKATYKRFWQSAKGKASNKRPRRTEKDKARQKRYRIRHPEQSKAHFAIRYAIAAGRIPRPDTLQCSCGKQAKEYHHPNYAPEYWLNVIPLCIKCHLKFRLVS